MNFLKVELHFIFLRGGGFNFFTIIPASNLYPPILFLFFHWKLIFRNFFVYNKNWPSYDFLKIDKTPKFFQVPSIRLGLRPVSVRVKTRPVLGRFVPKKKLGYKLEGRGRGSVYLIRRLYREVICGRRGILQGYCWRMRHCERGI